MVTKDTLILDIEKNYPQTDIVFEQFKMGHVGALLAFFDTLGESAQAHGVDPDAVVAAINNLLMEKSYAL